MTNLPDITGLLKLARQPAREGAVVMRAALLSDTASQLLAGALRGAARHLGFELELFEAEFDQIEMLVSNRGSELYAFRPETVIIYLAAERIASDFGALSVADRADFARGFAERCRGLHQALSSRGIQTLFFNLADPGDGVFGSYGNKVAWSLRGQVRACNQALARVAAESPDFNVYDLAALQSELGRGALFDPKLYFTSKFALAPGALPVVAREVVQMLAARKGSFLKCVILDLDNTLWGGVVAEDGLEGIELGELGLGPAFMAFQSWLKQLRDRGIVLAVCSKNDDATAREPFLKHPDMLLKLEDIAVFMANWDDKATNIRRIKSVIDVDYAAMMFLDDHPAERQLVRESFPSMLVPDLPEDPAEYVTFLAGLNAFETASYTAQDAGRTREYQVEAQRHAEREKFVDPEEFVRSLEMRARVRPFEPFNFPRIAQLTQRSNQFNLRTVRYSEEQIAALAVSPAHVTIAVELRDRFGHYGLISVVILEARAGAMFVDTWLMSCRVLGRGVEQLVLNGIVEAARERGLPRVIGEYLRTPKNGMVADHYPKLGFADDGPGRWALETAGYVERRVHIVPDPDAELERA